MGRGQEDSVFVFDEPTIGLHPKDVRVLLEVFRSLLDHGATVIVIEHDLDVIRSADYIIDMGPGGGAEGGRIVVSGSPAEIVACPESLTGQYMWTRRRWRQEKDQCAQSMRTDNRIGPAKSSRSRWLFFWRSLSLFPWLFLSGTAG
jgi:excinuclease ABC subunit A